MTLREKIEETLSEERETVKRPSFKKLSEFYKEKKEEGVAIKREYDLPPLDTVGRALYREVSNKARHKR
jgi:predicted Zn-dependent peptidase